MAQSAPRPAPVEDLAIVALFGFLSGVALMEAREAQRRRSDCAGQADTGDGLQRRADWTGALHRGGRAVVPLQSGHGHGG